MTLEWHEVFHLNDERTGSFEVKAPHWNDVLFAAAGYGCYWNGRVQVSSSRAAQAHTRELLGGTLYAGEHRSISIVGFRLFRFLLLRLDIVQPLAFSGEGPVPTPEELWAEARQPPAESESAPRPAPTSDVPPASGWDQDLR